MNAILDVLLNNILPVFLAAVAGYVLRRFANLDKLTVSRLTFYVFSPALVFSLIVNSELVGAEFVRLVGFAAVQITLMAAIGWVIGRFLRLDSLRSAALMLCAMFGNAGNFGLPLNQLRYDEAGLETAAAFFMTSAVLAYTLGLFIATSGKSSARESLERLSRQPVIYAIAIAVLIRFVGWTPPFAVVSAIDILSEAAVPVMLVVLGMQFADVKELADIKLSIPAIGLRLIASPILAVLLAIPFGLTGLGYQTSILQASVPVAVVTIVIATEFDVMPKAVTSTVVLSTLLSPITLVAVIQLFNL